MFVFVYLSTIDIKIIFNMDVYFLVLMYSGVKNNIILNTYIQLEWIIYKSCFGFLFGFLFLFSLVGLYRFSVVFGMFYCYHLKHVFLSLKMSQNFYIRVFDWCMK